MSIECIIAKMTNLDTKLLFKSKTVSFIIQPGCKERHKQEHHSDYSDARTGSSGMS
jgi:hypothetical protein